MSFSSFQTRFSGQKDALFGLAFRTSLLTLLTVGFYRFWMKTRMRRYLWSAIEPGGTPLEYTGRGSEKLLGFLIAVVFLAFYIGVVNLILMFVSFTVLNGPGGGYLLSFVGLIPMYFFARYRARRYILARTRWRGIRFGLEPGAWGYAWRAMIHWLVSIASLGLLWPRMTFWLEKYRTDRTWFGDQNFVQGGKWTMLYRPYLQAILPIYVSAAVIAAISFAANGITMAPILFLSIPWALVGFVHYRVQSFRILAENKSLGGVSFEPLPRSARVLGIYVGGYLMVGLVSSLALTAMAIVLGALAGVFGATSFDFIALANGNLLPYWFVAAFGALTYFAVFILYGALNQTFVTLPLIGHYAETLAVHGAENLTAISQRERDEATEAGGFAEALDVGAAI